MFDVSELVAHWGYLAVFVIVVLGNVGLPVPEETALLAAGYLVWRGDLRLSLLLTVGIVSAVVGDNLGYWIGRRWGQGGQTGSATGKSPRKVHRSTGPSEEPGPSFSTLSARPVPDSQLVNLASVTPTTIQTMRSFVPPPNLPENNRVSPVEATVWVVDGTLTLYKEEDDSDYHLILQDQAGNTMITEIPSPSCVGAGSPFAEGIARVRSKFDGMFSATGSFQMANVPVRVTGVGFFDFLHGQTGVAPNGIELHPVLDIVFNPSPSALSLNLTLNTHIVAAGDLVQVSVTAANPGGAGLVDLYFVILLPAASGPSLGCLNGDAAAFFGNALSTVVVTCVSAPPQTFPILFPHLSVPAGLPATGVSNFFSFTWPASAPAGTYTFAIFATPPDAFSDGTIDSGDVPTFAFDSLSFSP